ncbi:targeting protein for Xklp2-like [Leptopilina heterotoma]|uniref:targeting protein for Xklp2-like n=1 Tax=Leptopilina heterotoma TaxID=63436 RepID=UPI001CA933B0|nr:targeting protein for Xklp2-like [Leptopilina heterotoma]XP_043480661.1 targeting protein for Xklp2-like [Leptopilina heterotoma]
MDGLDAPQWTDFTSSPQMSDDFFIRQHPEHELEYNARFKQNRLKYKEKPLFLTDDESAFDTVLDKVQITPVKVLSPNKNNKDDKVQKETTVGNLLLEAMNNLELSTKKKRLNQSMANSSINKTPQLTDKRITRSMKASMNFENISQETSSKVKLNESQVETPRKKIVKNILNEVSKIESTTTTIKIQNVQEQSMEPQIMTEPEADGNLLPDIIVTSNLSKTDNKHTDNSKEEETQTVVETVIETKISYQTSNFDEPTTSKSTQEIDEIDSTLNDSKLKPSKFVTSWSKPNMKKFNDLKETKKLTNPAPKKRIQVVANSIRRKSILKLKSNDQYKSMAESVSKFQKETPKRFHSVSTKTNKPQTTKQPAMKITRPVSPNLTSKNRIRPIRVQDKTQNPTIKKLHNGPIKADPKAISIQPAKFQKPKKIETYESKKGHFSSTESLSSTSQIHETTASHSKLDHSVQKKLVPTIVSTDDAKLAVKEVEIGHFGIPTDTNHKPKKFTRATPFSFETRNKELQQKKELDAKRKQLQELEKKDAKDTKEFLKKKITPLKNHREVSSAKKTTPRPFSFEQRDKQLIKKKEDLLKETIEKEKKVREFHANPLPQFRPVIVRGRSRENLRSTEKTPEKNHQKPTTIPKVCTIKKSLFPQKFTNDQENQPNAKLTRGISSEKLHPNNQIKKTVLGELILNTDKRARERKEYEDRVRMKELQEEEMRKKQEEERLIREKAEIAELRKMTETKARPVPKFKPLAIIKSTKILTDPQSPAWAYKHKKF